MTKGSLHCRFQQGIALVTGLIFLLLMTLIGVTAIQTTTLDEKMAGNARDRSLAFQAAEAALRDAERDFSANGRGISGLTGFVADCGAAASGDTDDGLCYNGPSGYGTPIWTTANMTASPSVPYGRFTGATAIPNVSAQPRYLIQGFRSAVAGSSGNRFYYRITVRAQGASANTVVWLQTVYVP